MFVHNDHLSILRDIKIIFDKSRRTFFIEVNQWQSPSVTFLYEVQRFDVSQQLKSTFEHWSSYPQIRFSYRQEKFFITTIWLWWLERRMLKTRFSVLVRRALETMICEMNRLIRPKSRWNVCRLFLDEKSMSVNDLPFILCLSWWNSCRRTMRISPMDLLVEVCWELSFCRIVLMKS